MFQKQGDKAAVLSEMIDNMAEKLQASLGVEEFSSLCIPTQEEVYVTGRICCDSNGKLNSQSVIYIARFTRALLWTSNQFGPFRIKTVWTFSWSGCCC